MALAGVSERILHPARPFGFPALLSKPDVRKASSPLLIFTYLADKGDLPIFVLASLMELISQPPLRLKYSISFFLAARIGLRLRDGPRWRQ